MNDVTTIAHGRRMAATREWPADAAAWLARIAAIAPTVAAGSPAADRDRRLTDETMAALHGEGLLRLLLPREFGGAQISPPVLYCITEALAAVDGSASWCACQGSGCAMMAAYLPPAVAHGIWDDPRAVLAWGPGKAEARVVDGGYSVTARISFVSGGRHATWFGAHCTVFERDGSVRIGADGVPEIRTVLFPSARAPMIDMWDVIGLRGTGSDGYAIDDLFVPDDHTVVRETAVDRPGLGPIYRFSQMGIYAIGFAGTAMGLARAFLDAFLPLAQDKKPRNGPAILRDNPVVQDELARCEARLLAARAFLLGESERIWDAVVAADAMSIEQRMRIRLASVHAIQEAKAVVDTLYDTVGASAIFASGPFERRFRDIHTVAQQIQGRKTHYQIVGAWMMGHPPDLLVI
ncbi:MAG: acyl-CoA dehydrogenase family protein [Rhodospirillales bacterium]